ncbi:Neural-cadherin, partial [Trichinella nelsoni]
LRCLTLFPLFPYLLLLLPLLRVHAKKKQLMIIVVGVGDYWGNVSIRTVPAYIWAWRHLALPEDTKIGSVVLTFEDQVRLDKPDLGYFCLHPTSSNKVILAKDLSDVRVPMVLHLLLRSNLSDESKWERVEKVLITVIPNYNRLRFDRHLYVGFLPSQISVGDVIPGLEHISLARHCQLSVQPTFRLEDNSEECPFRLDVIQRNETSLPYVKLRLAKPLLSRLPVYRCKLRVQGRPASNCDQTTLDIYSEMRFTRGTFYSRPLFPRRRYYVTISKDVPVGTTITRLEASCHQLGLCGFTYQLESKMPVPFDVESFNGDIFTTGLLEKDQYQFYISARPSGAGMLGKDSCLVTVTVNPNAMALTTSRNKRELRSELSFSLPEDAPLGYLFLLIPLQYNEAVKNAPVVKSHFTVHRNGSLELTEALNYETEKMIHFSIIVENLRTMESSVQQIVITVLDVYEKPKFINQPVPYWAIVPVEVPVGFTVYSLLARCEGGDGSSDVEYRLISTEPPNTFTVDRQTGRIKTALSRYLYGHSYRVYVQAHDMRMGMQPNADSEIAVVDIMGGSRAPQFYQEKYQISVSEDTPVSASVAQIKAISFENNPELKITYSLWEDTKRDDYGNSPDDFSIDKNTGVVHLMRSLDYDDPLQPRAYALKVIASEGKKSTEVPVEIQITDVNDNAPVFTQPLYAISIKEDHPIGNPILQVSARDKDSGLNSEIEYSLTDHNFTIDNQGVISPKVRLDADQTMQGFYIYKFDVIAKDRGNPAQMATSQIHIRTENVNDEAPIFLPTSMYTEYVAEDAEGNTPIATIQALDPDRDQVKYAFLRNGEQSQFLSHFEIDRDTGLIKLREGIGPKDLHDQDFYMLTVVATDDGPDAKHSSTATVRIGVKDVNNNKPVFHNCEKYSSEAKVPEGKHDNYVVLMVQATDDDSGQNGDILYSLYYPQGETRKPFVIDAITGELRASPYVEFDREERPFEDVIVKATDKGTRPLIGFCQFTVTVLDENDNSPEFDRATYEASVSRSTPVGQSVLTVFADDRDAPNNAKIAYSLQEDLSEPEYIDDVNYFSIKKDGGEIMLFRPLPVNKNKMMFLVIAKDSGEPPRSSQARVSIDIAEAAQHYPVWQVTPSCPNHVVVDEDVQINYVFFECHALSGADPSNPISYSMRNGAKPDTNLNQDFREFQEKRDGRDWVVIRNLKSLDYEKTKSYDLTISATDLRNGLSRDKTLTVKLRDKNDNVPKFTLDKFTGQVEEEQDVSVIRNQILVTVVAKDNDEKPEFKDITYKILPGSASHLFRIDSKLGAIYAVQSFDRELNDSFVLDVQAEDNAPSDLPGARGPNRDITKVQILVQDINDNAPYFNETVYRGRVRENSEVGQNVMTVKAHDLDKDSELRYSLDSRGNDGSAFSVGASSGTIFVNEPLDYERKKLYDLTLHVTDGNREHKAQTRIQIAIEDVNDNSPQFEQSLYRAVIQEEDKNVPKKLLHVIAYDKDDDVSSKRIVYKLAGQGANDEFSVNEITGDIYVTKPLDRDPPNGAEEWNFVVQAIDDGGKGLIGYADVQVILTDINDNAPFFKGSPFTGYVTENIAPSEEGVYVMTMSATDNDDPRTSNAKLIYSILRNKYLDGRPVFRIDPHSGKIFAMMELDRENSAQKEFEIEVKATDQGRHPLSGTGIVIIKVVDVNDNPPYFYPPSYDGTVKETLPVNSPVMSLSASDLDSEAVDNVLQYSLEENNQLGFNYFYMTTEADSSGSTVGVIRVKQPLDFEDPLQRVGFNLTVRVSDGRFSSWAPVRIRLLDENDNAPEFVNAPQAISLLETVRPGTVLVAFTVRDRDAGDDTFESTSEASLVNTAANGKERVLSVGTIVNISEASSVGLPVAHFETYLHHPGDLVGTNYTFRIVRESDPKLQFTIGEKDGVLRVARPLDREDIAQYRLRIEALDSANNVGYILLVVNLEDVNDNAPFLKYQPPAVVMENEKPGTHVINLTAYDPDGPGNGPPFFMKQADNSTYADKFEMTFDQSMDGGNGGLIVKTKKTFDREDFQTGKTLLVPIYVSDSGKPKQEAIRILQIVIGDKNDNPMSDGRSIIHVYTYETFDDNFPIGQVYVEDLDDWDLAEKNFTLVHGPSEPYFTVDNHGTIVMSRTTPVGEYHIVADVWDRIRDERAQGEVVIVVEPLAQEALDNAVSLKLQGLTAEEFVRPINGKSYMELFKHKLATLVDVDVDNVQIFSIRNDGGYPQKIDLYFAVHGSGYYSPTLVYGLLQQNFHQFQAELTNGGHPLEKHIDIVQINLDPCTVESCNNGCQTLLTVGNRPLVVNGNETVIAGVNITAQRQCTCPIRPLPSHCTEDTCYNDAICHDTGVDFFCECRGLYKGPRCAGHVRSFRGLGWAWFEPVQTCQKWNISLEFITQNSNGIILYNGPMLARRHDVREMFVKDFLYIAVVRGQLVVNVDFGGMPMSVTSTLDDWKVDDGRWHTLELFASGKEVRVILDKCRRGNRRQHFDWNRCELKQVVQLDNDQLNSIYPLQLGGIAPVHSGIAFRDFFNTTDGFDGCLRNVYLNGKILDLANPLRFDNSEMGCPQTDHFCETNRLPEQHQQVVTHCLHGECVASFHDYTCHCEPGWYGPKCDIEARWKTFGPMSYVRYLMALADTDIPLQYSKLEVSFFPDSGAGTLFSASHTEKNHSMHLMIEDRILNYLLSFGPDVMTKAKMAHFQLARNQTYHVVVERTREIVRFNVDGLVYYLSMFELSNKNKQFFMDYDSNSFRVGSTNHGNSGFRGCIRKVTFDDYWLPLDSDTAVDYAKIDETFGVSDGCTLLQTCASLPGYCSPPLVCVDFWKGPFCTCPPDSNHWIQNGQLYCGRPLAAMHLGITHGAVAAILVTLLTLIVLVLLLVVYSRRRHQSPLLIRPEDDIRENIINYAEEGGGEEDQDAYNIAALRKPVLPIEDDPSMQLPNTDDHNGTHRRPAAKDPLSGGGDLNSFIKNRLNNADQDPMVPPFDELRVYANEDDAASVGSLSSLSSPSSGSEIDWDEVNKWGGEAFKKLADMYGDEE